MRSDNDDSTSRTERDVGKKKRYGIGGVYGMWYYIGCILVVMVITIALKTNSNESISHNKSLIFSNAENISLNANSLAEHDKVINENQTMLKEISNTLEELKKKGTPPEKNTTYMLHISIKKKSDMGFINVNDLEYMMVSVPTDKDTYDRLNMGDPIPYEAYETLGASVNWEVKVLNKERIEGSVSKSDRN